MTTEWNLDSRVTVVVVNLWVLEAVVAGCNSAFCGLGLFLFFFFFFRLEVVHMLWTRMSLNGIVVPEFRIRILRLGVGVGLGLPRDGRPARVWQVGSFTDQVLNKSSEVERSFPECQNLVCSLALRLRSLVVLAKYVH